MSSNNVSFWFLRECCEQDEVPGVGADEREVEEAMWEFLQDIDVNFVAEIS